MFLIGFHVFFKHVFFDFVHLLTIVKKGFYRFSKTLVVNYQKRFVDV